MLGRGFPCTAAGTGSATNNIVSGDIKTIPWDGEGVTATNSAAAWIRGAYEEITSGLATDIYVLGVSYQSNASRLKLILATGSAGDESDLAICRIGPSRGSVHFFQTPYKVTSGTRISTTLENYWASQKYAYVRMIYTDSASSGGIINLGCDNTNEDGYNAVATGSGIWTFGAWKTIIPDNTITADYYLRAIQMQISSASLSNRGLVEIGIGEAAAPPTTIIEVPFETYSNYTKHIMLNLGLIKIISANQSLSARVADQSTAANTCLIGLDWTIGGFE